MSPAPAGKVALPCPATHGGEAVSACVAATRSNKRGARRRPSASRVTPCHPWFRVVRADTVGGGPTGVATVSQCGGPVPDGIGRTNKPSKGSGVATGTRKGGRPSRSEWPVRNHRTTVATAECTTSSDCRGRPSRRSPACRIRTGRNLRDKRQDPWRKANGRGDFARCRPCGQGSAAGTNLQPQTGLVEVPCVGRRAVDLAQKSHPTSPPRRGVKSPAAGSAAGP